MYILFHFIGRCASLFCDRLIRWDRYNTAVDLQKPLIGDMEVSKYSTTWCRMLKLEELTKQRQPITPAIGGPRWFWWNLLYHLSETFNFFFLKLKGQVNVWEETTLETERFCNCKPLQRKMVRQVLTFLKFGHRKYKCMHYPTYPTAPQ